MGTRDGCLSPQKSMGEKRLAQGSSWSPRCPWLAKGTAGAVVAKGASMELGGDRLVLFGNTGQSKYGFKLQDREQTGNKRVNGAEKSNLRVI